MLKGNCRLNGLLRFQLFQFILPAAKTYLLGIRYRMPPMALSIRSTRGLLSFPSDGLTA